MKQVIVAYLDPGSGSMLLQILLGGIASVAVALKMFGKRIVSVLTFWKRDNDDDAAKPASPKPENDAA